jgi:outer membrane beta-barrel protein
MNQARIGLLVIAAMLAGPSYAYAQKRPKKPAATKTAKTAPAAEAQPAAAAPAGGPVELDADNPQAAPAGETPADAAPGTEPAAGTPGEAGGLGDICQIDPTACPTLDLNKAAAQPLKEQMYAVQQVYALRARRFEIQPAWNITLNDQFVDHPGPVLGLNYYVTNVLAIGLNGGYYFNSDKVFNAQTRRAARVAVPLTEYLWQAALNFTYVPMYGKFAGFSDFIFHYDVYMVGGVGAIMTRPIAVVDPDNRSFKWGDPKVAFNVGIGLRIFFNRWFAADLEIRDYIFQDKLENTEIAPTALGKANDQTWYGENKITNNVQAQLGVSIFLPTSWEYRLPK